MSVVTKSRLQDSGNGSMHTLFAIRNIPGFKDVDNSMLFRGVFGACVRRDFKMAADVIHDYRAQDLLGAACARQYAVSRQHDLAIVGEAGNVKFSFIPHPAQVDLFRKSAKLILDLIDELTGNRHGRQQQLPMRPAIITGGTIEDPLLPLVIEKLSDHHCKAAEIVQELISYGVGGWLLLGDGEMAL